jgi:hypothetical protein
MSRCNCSMRWTSRKKRSAIFVFLFHDFTINDAIFPASMLSTSVRIFSVVQQHVTFHGGMITERSPTISSAAVTYIYTCGKQALCLTEAVVATRKLVVEGRRPRRRSGRLHDRWERAHSKVADQVLSLGTGNGGRLPFAGGSGRHGFSPLWLGIRGRREFARAFFLP